MEFKNHTSCSIKIKFNQIVHGGGRILDNPLPKIMLNGERMQVGKVISRVRSRASVEMPTLDQLRSL